MSVRDPRGQYEFGGMQTFTRMVVEVLDEIVIACLPMGGSTMVDSGKVAIICLML